MHHLRRSRARPVADGSRARDRCILDHEVNLGTVNEHQNRSLFNFRKPKGPDVTATLRHVEAPSASYLVWYGSAPGGAE